MSQTKPFQLGQRVHISKTWFVTAVAGQTGIIVQPPVSFGWPIYFKENKKRSGIERSYWVELEVQNLKPGDTDAAEIDESSLSLA